VSRPQYEQIKALIREDRDADTLIAKEMDDANVIKLIKIYHYEIEIARC
jgi:hypothetical protein